MSHDSQDKRIRSTGLLGAALSICLGISGCFSPPSSISIASKAPENPDETPILTDPFKAICDPMGSIAPSPTRNKGLTADLYFIPTNGVSHVRQAVDIQEQGRKVDAVLFFTQLFIPTRRFELGFITQKGDAIKDANGEALSEWFSLHIESAIRLNPEKKPGFYQFALLADDGATLKVDQGQGPQVFIDNDKAHQSRLVCSQKAIQLDPKKPLPIQIDYFQGPRFHIALSLLYRNVPSENELNDPICGAMGNDLFFDSTQTPSVPTDTWRQLLKRGWKVVPADEYELPKKVGGNPCSVPRFNVFRRN